MIEQADRDILPAILEALPGAFVTGSYLVNKRKANDIDVVVSDTGFRLYVATHDALNLDGTFDISGVDFVPQESEEDDHYADADNDMYELHSHLRAGSINVLIIRDFFVPAYRAASYYLENNPKAFEERDARVEIHQKMKSVIRAMLAQAADSGDDIPW